MHWRKMVLRRDRCHQEGQRIVTKARKTSVGSTNVSHQDVAPVFNQLVTDLRTVWRVGGDSL